MLKNLHAVVLVIACGSVLLGCSAARNVWSRKQVQNADQPAVAEKPKQKELPAARAAEACLLTAQQLEEAGKDTEAIQQYERARRFQPELAAVPHRLAILYARSADTVRAEKEFALALTKNAKDADVHNDWGFYLASQARWSEAESAYRRAIELAPDHARAKTNLALALGEQREYDASFRLFEEVSGTAAAHRNIGVLLARHDRPDDARAALSRAIAADPSDKRATQLLAAVGTSKH